MPRKAVLSAAQQAALIALPSAEHDLRLHYTLSENDLAIIRSKRGPHNRLGFAIQLCYLRFPGQAMTLEAEPPAEPRCPKNKPNSLKPMREPRPIDLSGRSIRLSRRQARELVKEVTKYCCGAAGVVSLKRSLLILERCVG